MILDSPCIICPLAQGEHPEDIAGAPEWTYFDPKRRETPLPTGYIKCLLQHPRASARRYNM